MAIVKYDNASYNVSTDWEGETIIKNVLKVGTYNIELDDYSGGGAALQINLGGYCDVEGTIYYFDSNTTVATPGSDNTWYLYLDCTGAPALSLSTTGPTYDEELFGYYNGANVRALIKFDYAGATYSNVYPMGRKYFPYYSRIAGDLDLGGDLSIEGSTNVDGLVASSTIAVSGQATFNGTAAFNSTMTLDAGDTFTNSGTITSNGAINLDGTVTLKSSMALNANASYTIGAAGTRAHTVYAVNLTGNNTATVGAVSCTTSSSSGAASCATLTSGNDIVSSGYHQAAIYSGTTRIDGVYWVASNAGTPNSGLSWCIGAYSGSETVYFLYTDHNLVRRRVNDTGSW